MPLLPNAAREIATMFYAPQLMAQAKRMQGAVEYRHPVTGKAESATVPDLMEQAADRAAELCRDLEQTIFHGKTPALPGNGPSMDAGLTGAPASAMRHFANPSFPKLP